jgi:hypothetical protein
MSKMAVLTKVNNVSKVKLKLPNWTSEDPNKIVSDVLGGKKRNITDMNVEGCKKDLEADGAAVVEIEQLKD